MASTDRETHHYRPGVGIVLARSPRQVFVGRRISKDSNKLWQMPQGGIEKDEDPEVAMWRELAEETGVLAEYGSIVDQTDWLFYDIPHDVRSTLWGNRYVGQCQKWYLVEFLGQDSDVRLDSGGAPAEFDAWKWLDFAEIDTHIVPFKRDLYQQIQRLFDQSINKI